MLQTGGEVHRWLTETDILIRSNWTPTPDVKAAPSPWQPASPKKKGGILKMINLVLLNGLSQALCEHDT